MPAYNDSIDNNYHLQRSHYACPYTRFVHFMPFPHIGRRTLYRPGNG